jgi:tight adherence protein C
MAMTLLLTIAGAVLGLATRPRPQRVHLTTASLPAPRAGDHLRRVRPRARERAIDAHFADTIELVVLAVRAGHLPLAAIRAVHPHMAPELRDGFGSVLREVANGQRFAEALRALPDSLGPRAHALADSFAAADRDGLPLAPVLDRLAQEARSHRRRRADTLARQLPVRMSLPLVLCTLPSFVLLAVAPLLLAAFASLRR